MTEKEDGRLILTDQQKSEFSQRIKNNFLKLVEEQNKKKEEEEDEREKRKNKLKPTPTPTPTKKK